MADRQVARKKGGSREESVNGFGRDRRGRGNRIGLKLRGLLALDEVRAGGVAPFLIEEMVDQVRGERDQVGDKKTAR